MNRFEIKTKTGKTLFKSKTSTQKECLEQAVNQGINLNSADLSFSNLSNITIDGAHLQNADFTGSNLTGANISEAMLKGASFKNTDLYNACLSESDLTKTNFSGANFGGTMINDSNISGALFSTLSCFSLDFSTTKTMENCLFKTIHGKNIEMSRPPKVFLGITTKPYIMFDKETCHGHTHISNQEWMAVFSKTIHNTKKKKHSIND